MCAFCSDSSISSLSLEHSQRAIDAVYFALCLCIYIFSVHSLFHVIWFRLWWHSLSILFKACCRVLSMVNDDVEAIIIFLRSFCDLFASVSFLSWHNYAIEKRTATTITLTTSDDDDERIFPTFYESSWAGISYWLCVILCSCSTILR